MRQVAWLKGLSKEFSFGRCLWVGAGCGGWRRTIPSGSELEQLAGLGSGPGITGQRWSMVIWIYYICYEDLEGLGGNINEGICDGSDGSVKMILLMIIKILIIIIDCDHMKVQASPCKVIAAGPSTVWCLDLDNHCQVWLLIAMVAIII